MDGWMDLTMFRTCTLCAEYSESCVHGFNAKTPPEIPANVSSMSEGHILTSGRKCRKPLLHMLLRNCPLRQPVYVYAYSFDQLDQSGGASRALCRRASGRLDEKHQNPKVVEGKLHLWNSKRTRSAGDVLDPHCTSFVSMSDNTAALLCVDDF